MAFKLGDKRVNPLKSKGFMNADPFKSNGNTMVYANGEPEGNKKPVKTAEQKAADAKAKKQAQDNMEVVRTETNKVDGGTETIEYLEGEGKGKTFKEAGVDPAAGQAYWDANPEKYQEYLASKKLKDQNRTFVPDKNPRPEPPKTDYSYLDGASIKQGYRDGDGTMYGNQVASNVGGNGTGSGDQREGEDPMSRYLTQEELDYLYEKRGSKGPKPSAGYDALYSNPNKKLVGKKPGAISAFDKAVRDGLIDKDGKTIPLNPQIKKDNLVEEVSPGFNSKI
jgi:hypothetical protein